MLIVALTGGIGSGKSTVAELFATHGVPIIDTDIIARELVQPGQPALREIVVAFGSGMLTSTGELDRKRLRELVFANPTARMQLEAILHPKINAAVIQRIDLLNAPYCILVIPLLAETKQSFPHDRVLVVDSSEAEQTARVMTRDTLTETQVRQILAAQTNREQRLALADDVINNSGDQRSLIEQVQALHSKYMMLCKS